MGKGGFHGNAPPPGEKKIYVIPITFDYPGGVHSKNNTPEAVGAHLSKFSKILTFSSGGSPPGVRDMLGFQIPLRSSQIVALILLIRIHPSFL